MTVGKDINAIVGSLISFRKAAFFSIWPLLLLSFTVDLFHVAITGNVYNVPILSYVIQLAFLFLMTFHWHRVMLFGENCRSIFLARNADGEYLSVYLSYRALKQYAVRFGQVFLLPVLILSGVFASYLTAMLIVRHPILIQIGDFVSLSALIVIVLVLPSTLLSLAAVASGSRKHKISDGLKIGWPATFGMLTTYGTIVGIVALVVLVITTTLFIILVIGSLIYGVADGISVTLSMLDQDLILQGVAINFDIPYTEESIVFWFEGVSAAFLDGEFAIRLADIVTLVAIKCFIVIFVFFIVTHNALLYRRLRKAKKYHSTDRLYEQEPIPEPEDYMAYEHTLEVLNPAE